MELSQEKKTQIAACHAKGMTVKEIAEKAKLTEAQVDVFLQDQGKKPNYSKRKEKGKHLSADKKTEVIALLKEGKGITEVSKITEVNIKTVGYYKSKLDKEKEPESAATDTSSMDVKQIESSGTVSASKYTIAVRKSQAQRALDITKKTLKDIYEYMNEAEQRAFDLGEAFGRICTAIEEEEE